MPDTGSLTGQDINQKNNQPIADASLRLAGEGLNKESSGNDGGFKFEGLPPGKCELVAKKEGFEDGIYGPLDVIADHPTDITVALQPSNI